MPSLFDRMRRYRPPDWTDEFAHPAPPGRWIVQPDRDQWRILDDRGVVRLLFDKGASVRTINGDRLLSLAPDIAGTMVPRSSAGVVDGVVEFALGAALGPSPQTGMPIGGWGGAGMSSWLVRETGGLVIARVDAQTEGGRIELLPGGALNSKLIARRFSPALATHVRALGPLGYALIKGSPIDGVGQLRGPAGQVIATDRFTYLAPVRRSGTLRRDLGTWTIDVDNNPFPLAWLVALLRATKTVN